MAGKRVTQGRHWAACAFLCVGFAGRADGQEVDSDVMIPPPQVAVSSVLAIEGGLFGQEDLFTSTGPDRAFQGVLSQAASGRWSERETRGRLGDFMTSLLMRGGILDFHTPPTQDTPRSASTSDRSGPGGRPAWTGPTPMSISAARPR